MCPLVDPPHEIPRNRGSGKASGPPSRLNVNRHPRQVYILRPDGWSKDRPDSREEFRRSFPGPRPERVHERPLSNSNTSLSIHLNSTTSSRPKCLRQRTKSNATSTSLRLMNCKERSQSILNSYSRQSRRVSQFYGPQTPTPKNARELTYQRLVVEPSFSTLRRLPIFTSSFFTERRNLSVFKLRACADSHKRVTHTNRRI